VISQCWRGEKQATARSFFHFQLRNWPVCSAPTAVNVVRKKEKQKRLTQIPGGKMIPNDCQPGVAEAPGHQARRDGSF
jgi:hypothetical protein